MYFFEGCYCRSLIVFFLKFANSERFNLEDLYHIYKKYTYQKGKRNVSQHYIKVLSEQAILYPTAPLDLPKSPPEEERKQKYNHYKVIIKRPKVTVGPFTTMNNNNRTSKDKSNLFDSSFHTMETTKFQKKKQQEELKKKVMNTT